MRIALEKGDVVKLLPATQLFELFERRNVFSEEFRKEASEKLGSKHGVVQGIEDKYAIDYFFFATTEESNIWSIPYQAVDFS